MRTFLSQLMLFLLLVMSLASHAADEAWRTPHNSACQVASSNFPPGQAVQDIEWQGQCSQGKASGPGILVYTAQERDKPVGARLEGEFVNGAIHGKGKRIKSDGRLYVGSFYQGRLTGTGRFTWPDGQSYEGQIRDSQYNGFGTMIWPSGQRYEGQWLNGAIEGWGRLRYEDGDIHEGQWKGGKRHGFGTFVSTNGTRSTGTYEDNKPKGVVNRTSATSRYEGEVDAEGKVHGQGVLNLGDERYAGSFSHGDYQGNGIYQWLPQGSIFMGRFRNDKANGHGVFVSAKSGKAHPGNFINGCMWDDVWFINAMVDAESCRQDKRRSGGL
jgi:hypothetical protein